MRYVHYNNPNMPELGLLEIVGEKAKAANGGWHIHSVSRSLKTLKT